MHTSLLETCPLFHLYVFAFDDISYKILTEKNLPNATIISLQQFENEQLLGVKKERSVAEYCWTCTPFTIKYCIENFALDNCTYVDADTFFYEDPTVLIREMGDNSVLITPHNYHPKYDQSAISGIYCVQFTTFKNTGEGMTVLNWWAQACLKWCYARYEDGKMGDQKYLDSWPYMFEGVHICRNQGAGLAPWNVLNYEFKRIDQKIIVNDCPLIFYHFHDLKYLSDGSWFLGSYDISSHYIENIYKPYILLLLQTAELIRKQYDNVDVLNAIDVKNIAALKFKFKIGIYRLDINKSFRQFITDLFFIDRKKQYKNNYIRLR